MYYLTDIELQDTIHNDIINPNIKQEIENLLLSRNKWRKVSNITETSGNIMIVLATIFSFSSGVYKDIETLSFVAGCINVMSLSLLKFSEYSSKESEERNKLLNDLLSKLKEQIVSESNINVLNNNVRHNVTPIEYY